MEKIDREKQIRCKEEVNRLINMRLLPVSNYIFQFFDIFNKIVYKSYSLCYNNYNFVT